MTRHAWSNGYGDGAGGDMNRWSPNPSRPRPRLLATESDWPLERDVRDLSIDDISFVLALVRVAEDARSVLNGADRAHLRLSLANLDKYDRIRR